MKLPDLYSYRGLASVFAFLNCMFAFDLLADYIKKHVIQSGDVSNGIGTPLVFCVLFGLFFNLILQYVLMLRVFQEKLTVRRAWLMFGISYSTVWIFRVYEFYCGDCSTARDMFFSCNTLAIGLIIHLCCVYYVTIPFTLSPAWTPYYRQNQIDAQTQAVDTGNLNLPPHSSYLVSLRFNLTKMKLPDRLLFFALINYYSAFKVLADYTWSLVIQTTDESNGSKTVIVLLVIIVNVIFQFVLMFSFLVEEKFTADRIYFVVGILGSTVWTFCVYDWSGCSFGNGPMSTNCITLTFLAIIYQCYVHYAVLAFWCPPSQYLLSEDFINARRGALLQRPCPGVRNSGIRRSISLGNLSQRYPGISDLQLPNCRTYSTSLSHTNECR